MLGALLAAGVFGTKPLDAQEVSGDPIRIDAFGLIDRVSLSKGDYVKPYSGWGLTGSAALRSEIGLGAEAFLTITFPGRDGLSPWIFMPGAWATANLSEDPRNGFDFFLGVGGDVRTDFGLGQ